jgi:osmotically inducible protein OsmC
MIVRKVQTIWTGGLHNGDGELFGGVRDTYSLASRCHHGPLGTSPEELIAAAHGACFSMALVDRMEKAGFTPHRLAVAANVLFDNQAPKQKIDSILLQVVADAPGIDEETFIALAKDARSNCPLSLALANVRIILEATLA